MQNPTTSLPMPICERILYTTTLRSYEKILTGAETGEYQLDIIRRHRAKIEITVNYINETIIVNGSTYTTSINREYTYRKARGKNIEISDFVRFITHIKESAQPDSVFHWNTWCFLKRLCKSQPTNIN